MNFIHASPDLRTRAAHIALAVTSAATVLTLGVAAVTGLPAKAAGVGSEVAPRSSCACPKHRSTR